jgi:hypothetical protein
MPLSAKACSILLRPTLGIHIFLCMRGGWPGRESRVVNGRTRCAPIGALAVNIVFALRLLRCQPTRTGNAAEMNKKVVPIASEMKHVLLVWGQGQLV